MRQALIDEFSYASEAHSLGRILAIRAVETMSGQPFLKKLYLDYQRENLPPLGHVTDAQPGPVFHFSAGQVHVAGVQDAAAAHWLLAHDAFHQGGLADAVAAEQATNISKPKPSMPKAFCTSIAMAG